jgi:hypothetical protein
MTEPNEYLGSLDPDELQAEQEFLDSHWANDLLDAPHALIAVIETKTARAVLAERKRIITLLQADICPDWATQIFYCCDGACSAYSDAIALIKGEQK